VAVIGRLFAIFFGFLFACVIAGLVAIFALLFPEMSEISSGTFDPDTLNFIVGLGFVVVSGYALVPALLLVLVTEMFSVRSLLSYAIFGGLAGMCSYLAFVPFDTDAMTFTGIVRRTLEVMVGSGILGGAIYWIIAGRNAGVWREPSMAPPLPPPQN
jgi:hypothetical protein